MSIRKEHLLEQEKKDQIVEMAEELLQEYVIKPLWR